MNVLPQPLPRLGRMMVFIDGENLVCRYQDMIAAGRRRNDDTRHLKDVFAWAPRAVWPALNVVLRATYYTYAVGSDEIQLEIAGQIQALTFVQYNPPGHNLAPGLGNTLYPKVFKKLKNARNPKGVDIQLSVDALSNAYQDNLDVVYLVAGDGDYAPLVAECQRLGKSVFVAAVSSGLNNNLKVLADRFIDLDGIFFEP